MSIYFRPTLERYNLHNKYNCEYAKTCETIIGKYFLGLREIY